MTAKNFLNILNGNKQAMSGIGSGKVIDRFSIKLNIVAVNDDLHLLMVTLYGVVT